MGSPRTCIEKKQLVFIVKEDKNVIKKTNVKAFKCAEPVKMLKYHKEKTGG